MIVTIDGPAGAGKSSVARQLAARLGFRFLDTGAMYRAVALMAVRRGVSWEHPERIAELAAELDLQMTEQAVLVDGIDVTAAIRGHEVSRLTRYAANNPGVRSVLVERQRQIASQGDYVTEGRDQGSVVFPQAECKIFLTASPVERARRRMHDLATRGEHVALEQILADQEARDRSDASRSVGPLVQPADAVEIVTDGLAPDQVVDRLEALVRSRMSP